MTLMKPKIPPTAFNQRSLGAKVPQWAKSLSDAFWVIHGAMGSKKPTSKTRGHHLTGRNLLLYIYILYNIYTWVNYNDLTATSLESWLVRGIIPKLPYFRLVKYYNLPIYIWLPYIYIYVPVYSRGCCAMLPLPSFNGAWGPPLATFRRSLERWRSEGGVEPVDHFKPGRPWISNGLHICIYI